MSNGFVTSVSLAFQDAYSAGVSQARNSFAGIQSALEDIGQDNGMLQLASNLSIATNMTEPLRQGLARALDVPSQKAASLESAMAAVHSVLNESNAINGDVAASYETIRAAALDWSAGVTEGSLAATATSNEFVETTYQMVSAGLDAADAINATRSAIIVAEGTMGDATDAASLITDIYANMGGEISNIGDVLARTQGQFKFPNLNLLTSGLQESMVAANQFGVELPHLTTAIGMLNNAGIAGSRAGTAFRNMLVQLPKAAQQLGFEIVTTADGALDLNATLAGLHTVMGGFDDQVSAANALAQAFGQEAAPAAATLAGNLDAFVASSAEAANVTGEAASMAFRMSDTYEQSAERLSNVAAVWQTSIGDSTNNIKRFFNDMAAGTLRALAPVLDTPVGGFLSSVGAGLALAAQSGLGFVSSGLQVASQLTLIVSAAQNAGGFMNLFKNTLGLFRAPFAAIKAGALSTATGVGGMGAATAATTPAVGVATGANVGFAASLWAVVAPVLAVVGVVALIAGAAFLVVKHWDKITGFFSGLWDTVTGFFERAWDDVVSGFRNGVAWIRNTILGASDWVLAGVAVFMPLVGVPILLIKHWDTVKAFFAGIPDYLRGVWSGFLGWFTDRVNGLIEPFEKIGGFVSRIFGGGRDSGAAMMTEIAAGVRSQSDAVPDAVRASFETARAYMPSSDARMGPLSDLSYSGGAMMSTIAGGVAADTTLERSLDDILGGVLPGGFDPSAVSIDAATGGGSDGGTQIVIKQLTIQADEIEDALHFVRILEELTGVKTS